MRENSTIRCSTGPKNIGMHQDVELTDGEHVKSPSPHENVRPRVAQVALTRKYRTARTVRLPISTVLKRAL
eukprot:scaffold66725_cov31-Tisochrysis_lutea.AAC.3